jgi:hypothetical protein
MSGWIALKDELPEWDKWVLFWFVTVDPKNSGVVMGQMSSYETGQFWDASGVHRPLWRCSHWIPLPEPPA